jgi:hypothetical protein
MNPDFDASTNLNLPQPLNQGPPQQMPDQSSIGLPLSAPQQGMPMQPTDFGNPPIPQQMPMQPLQAAPAALGTGTPSIADDGDLIEKEWVLKAKQIVASTANDPFQQNRQLAIMKADYMQKRYGKIIKLTE